MRCTCLRRVLLFTVVALGFGLAPQAEARVLIKPDAYLIQMSNSNMTVACTSDDEHSPLVLWPTRPSANWSFETTGNGYYVINSQAMVLDGGTGKRGTPITLELQKQDWFKTMWKVVKHGRFYKFINLETGQAMTLTNGQRKPGSRIENAPVADTMDQLFCIQDLNNVGYCGEGGPYVDYADDSIPDKGGQQLEELVRLMKEGKAKQGKPDTSPGKVPSTLPKDGWY